MKKILSVFVCFIMAFSLFSFAGCDNADTKGYLDKIALLEQQLKETGADEVLALKAKVTELETTVSSLKGIIESTSTGNAALKLQLDKLNETIENLSKQLTKKDAELLEEIAALKSQLYNSEHGNEVLLAKIKELQAQLDNGDNAELIKQIANLTTLVNNTKALLDTANSSITAMQGKITALENSLATSNVKIAALENFAKGEGELPVYEVGVEGKDTFTFVNNGIKLFSVKIESFGKYEDYVGLFVRGKITNYSMPITLGLNKYLECVLIDSNSNLTYIASAVSDDLTTIGKAQELLINFKESNYTPILVQSSITHVVLGIPNNSSGSLIPYAIFKIST